MTQDTRKDRRVKIVSLNVRYKSATVDEFIENHAHDVSRGGIYIKTANPFPAGTLLKFEIRLASDQAVIAGVGRVVWKRDAAHGQGDRPAGMGVKFIKIDPPSTAVIDKLVNTRSDAGKAFEAEPETSTDVPPPVLQPAAAAAPKSPPPPKPAAAAGPPLRKATMMGIGSTGAPAGASSPPVAPPRPTPSTAPRPTSSTSGPLFPKTNPEAEMPPKQEQTVMKQAAELLEEALREAGGSMEDVGTNPLFSGSSPAAGEPPRAEAPAAAAPSDEDEAAKARALVAGLAAAPVEEKKGPSEPPPRTTRDTPVAKVSERPRASTRPAAPYVSRVSDAPLVPKKGGSTGVILVVVSLAAAAAAGVMYKDKLFGGAPPEPQAPSATVPAAAPATAAAPTASAAPAASAEGPAASASAAPSATASAAPATSASAAAGGASAAATAKAATPGPATPPAPTQTAAPSPTPTAAAAEAPTAPAPKPPGPTATPAPAPAPAAPPRPKPKPKPEEDNPY